MESIEQQEMGREVERTFGIRVKDLRLARGLTQESLAIWMTNAGYPMHQTTAAKIENGGRPTPVGEVAALAVLFNVPIGTFFDTSDHVTAHMELAKLAGTVATQARELAELDERSSYLRLEHAASLAKHARLERQVRQLEIDVEADFDAQQSRRGSKRSN